MTDVNRDGPSTNNRRRSHIRTKDSRKDPSMRITKILTRIPEEVTGGETLYGCINKDGEWEEGEIEIKKEGKLEFIALVPNLNPKFNWENIPQAMSAKDYVESQKKGKYAYKLPIINNNWYKL